MTKIIDPRNLNKEEAKKLLAFFESQTEKVWFKDQVYTFQDGGQFRFEGTVFERECKDPKRGVRFEFVDDRSIVGRGGYGTVHNLVGTLKIDNEGNSHFKLYRRGDADQKQRVVKIQKHAVSASLDDSLPFALKESGIVKTLDHLRGKNAVFGVSNNIIYSFMVMRKLKGEVLEDFLGDPANLTTSRRLAVTGAILQALEAQVTRAGFVHRDIKPGNIMVGKDGSVFIMDYGYSVSAGQRDGALVDNRGYFSPQAFDTDYTPNPKADVFSAGVVIARLWGVDKNVIRNRKWGDGLELSTLFSGVKGLSVAEKEHIKGILTDMLQYNERDRISIDQAIQHWNLPPIVSSNNPSQSAAVTTKYSLQELAQPKLQNPLSDAGAAVGAEFTNGLQGTPLDFGSRTSALLQQNAEKSYEGIAGHMALSEDIEQLGQQGVVNVVKTVVQSATTLTRLLIGAVAESFVGESMADMSAVLTSTSELSNELDDKLSNVPDNRSNLFHNCNVSPFKPYVPVDLLGKNSTNSTGRLDGEGMSTEDAEKLPNRDDAASLKEEGPANSLHLQWPSADNAVALSPPYALKPLPTISEALEAKFPILKNMDMTGGQTQAGLWLALSYKFPLPYELVAGGIVFSAVHFGLSKMEERRQQHIAHGITQRSKNINRDIDAVVDAEKPYFALLTEYQNATASQRIALKPRIEAAYSHVIEVFDEKRAIIKKKYDRDLKLWNDQHPPQTLVKLKLEVAALNYLGQSKSQFERDHGKIKYELVKNSLNDPFNVKVEECNACLSAETFDLPKAMALLSELESYKTDSKRGMLWYDMKSGIDYRLWVDNLRPKIIGNDLQTSQQSLLSTQDLAVPSTQDLDPSHETQEVKFDSKTSVNFDYVAEVLAAQLRQATKVLIRDVEENFCVDLGPDKEIGYYGDLGLDFYNQVRKVDSLLGYAPFLLMDQEKVDPKMRKFLVSCMINCFGRDPNARASLIHLAQQYPEACAPLYERYQNNLQGIKEDIVETLMEETEQLYQGEMARYVKLQDTAGNEAVLTDLLEQASADLFSDPTNILNTLYKQHVSMYLYLAQGDTPAAVALLNNLDPKQSGMLYENAMLQAYFQGNISLCQILSSQCPAVAKTSGLGQQIEMIHQGTEAVADAKRLYSSLVAAYAKADSSEKIALRPQIEAAGQALKQALQDAIKDASSTVKVNSNLSAHALADLNTQKSCFEENHGQLGLCLVQDFFVIKAKEYQDCFKEGAFNITRAKVLLEDMLEFKQDPERKLFWYKMHAVVAYQEWLAARNPSIVEKDKPHKAGEISSETEVFMEPAPSLAIETKPSQGKDSSPPGNPFLKQIKAQMHQDLVKLNRDVDENSRIVQAPRKDSLGLCDLMLIDDGAYYQKNIAFYDELYQVKSLMASAAFLMNAQDEGDPHKLKFVVSWMKGLVGSDSSPALDRATLAWFAEQFPEDFASIYALDKANCQALKDKGTATIEAAAGQQYVRLTCEHLGRQAGRKEVDLLLIRLLPGLVFNNNTLPHQMAMNLLSLEPLVSDRMKTLYAGYSPTSEAELSFFAGAFGKSPNGFQKAGAILNFAKGLGLANRLQHRGIPSGVLDAVGLLLNSGASLEGLIYYILPSSKLNFLKEIIQNLGMAHVRASHQQVESLWYHGTQTQFLALGSAGYTLYSCLFPQGLKHTNYLNHVDLARFGLLFVAAISTLSQAYGNSLEAQLVNIRSQAASCTKPDEIADLQRRLEAMTNTRYLHAHLIQETKLFVEFQAQNFEAVLKLTENEETLTSTMMLYRARALIRLASSKPHYVRDVHALLARVKQKDMGLSQYQIERVLVELETEQGFENAAHKRSRSIPEDESVAEAIVENPMQLALQMMSDKALEKALPVAQGVIEKVRSWVGQDRPLVDEVAALHSPATAEATSTDKKPLAAKETLQQKHYFVTAKKSWAANSGVAVDQKLIIEAIKLIYSPQETAGWNMSLSQAFTNLLALGHSEHANEKSFALYLLVHAPICGELLGWLAVESRKVHQSLGDAPVKPVVMQLYALLQQLLSRKKTIEQIINELKRDYPTHIEQLEQEVKKEIQPAKSLFESYEQGLVALIFSFSQEEWASHHIDLAHQRGIRLDLIDCIMNVLYPNIPSSKQAQSKRQKVSDLLRQYDFHLWPLGHGVALLQALMELHPLDLQDMQNDKQVFFVKLSELIHAVRYDATLDQELKQLVLDLKSETDHKLSYERIYKLLRQGASPNQVSREENFTCMDKKVSKSFPFRYLVHELVATGCADLIELFARFNADFTRQDFFGMTARDIYLIFCQSKTFKQDPSMITALSSALDGYDERTKLSVAAWKKSVHQHTSYWFADDLYSQLMSKQAQEEYVTGAGDLVIANYVGYDSDTLAECASITLPTKAPFKFPVPALSASFDTSGDMASLMLDNDFSVAKLAALREAEHNNFERLFAKNSASALRSTSPRFFDRRQEQATAAPSAANDASDVHENEHKASPV